MPPTEANRRKSKILFFAHGRRIQNFCFEFFAPRPRIGFKQFTQLEYLILIHDSGRDSFNSGAIAAVAQEAETIPAHFIDDGTLVVSCGSGVTLAGILRGLQSRPKKIVGVSVGRSVENIRRCLNRSCVELSAVLDIRAPTKPFHEAAIIDSPFSCDAHYDLKAWEVLVRELDSFPDPILFWNVGGR
jgi:hypothetical protein